MSALKRFAEISKVDEQDDGTVVVHGIASTETVDAQGETVTKGAMIDAIPDYLKHGTGALRSMHQPIAAGFVSKVEVNEAGETEITATVVDPVEVLKVKTGVYKGFSIGGSKLPGGYDKVTKTISKMKLVEISLVDRPANPEAVITMYKSDVAEATVAPEDAAAVDELAALLDSGEVSPQTLVAMVKAAKAEPAATDDKVEGKDADAAKKKKGNPFGKVDADGNIEKGMYQVSRLADLLDSLSCLVCSVEYEAEWEKDDSKVPEQLRAWLVAGADVFASLAEEEIAEFVATFKPAAAEEVVVVQLSDAATTLRKSLDDAAVDGLAAFLAVGKEHMPENDIAKAVLAGGYDSAAELILAKLDPSTELVAKLAAADGEIAKLAAERDEALAKIAKFNESPAPAKAVLRVIVKGGDLGAEPVAKGAEETGPIMKSDGTVDQEATALQEIRKIHQAGGRALRPIH